MHSCSVNFLLTLKDVLTQSGRGLNHKGHYQECLEHSHMKYSIIQFGSQGVDAQVFAGLCLPKQCTDSFISKSLDSALKIMGIPLNVFSIDSNTQNYEYPTNWLSYLTAGILIILGILVFAATVRGNQGKTSQSKQSERKEKGRNKWMGCFDLVANVKQHFKVRPNEDLNVLDGVRSLSMMWVVIGHSFTFSLSAGIINISNIQVVADKFSYLIIQAGLISVDIFLMLGGFFLSFIMLRSRVTGKLCALGILQRALRVWPAYILAMMFYYSLFLKLGSGMLWPKNEAGTSQCSTMWREIMFISNLIENGERACLGWGWYLQVDFQLFVMGVLMLFLYSARKHLFVITTALLSVLSLIFNYVYTFEEEIRIFTDLDAFVNFQDFMLNLYIKPYGRCVPYFMGLVFGLLFMEYRKERKNSPDTKNTLLNRLRHYFQSNNTIRVFIQWLGIALMAFVAFIPRPLQLGAKWPQEVHSLYWTFSKPVFLFGLILTVLPSCLGICHSFFNLILKGKVLVYIARISFCTYLVHLMVLYQFIFSRTYDIYYNLNDQFVTYLGLSPLILVCGFVMTVTIELPFGNMLKIGMQKLKSGEQPEKIKEKSASLLTTQSISEELIAKNDKYNLVSTEATQ